MSGFRNRISIDDSKFIFLPSGTFPTDYVNLYPALLYPSYFLDYIKPWKDAGDWSGSRFDNWTLGNIIDNYPIQEYWEFIPDSIRQFGKKYTTIPSNICISTFGRIYDYETKTAIPTYMRKDGYLGVFGMMALHRIVLYTFCPIANFLEMTVDHIDMNATNNCLWNLRWLSMYDNIKRSVDLGNRTNPYFQKGEANNQSTATAWQVELACRALMTHRYNYQQIAYATGLSVRQVKHLRDCDGWIDICQKFGLDKNNFDYRHLKAQTEQVLPLLEAIQE